MPPLRPPGLFLGGSFRPRPAPAARSPLEAPRRPPRASWSSSSSSSSVVPVLLRLLRAGGEEGPPWTSSSSRPPGPPGMEGEALRPLRALRAAAALGLPGEHRLVRALEEEARRRLARLGPEDAALALSDARGRPTPTPTLLDACLRRLEEALLEAPLPEPERAAVEEEEEALARCAPLAGEEALGALFRSAAFARHPHPLLVRRLAGCFPGKAEGCSPPTVAALALHLARHRLREPPLLDSIATFLLPRVQHLDLKVIQRLVFPFSRLSYQPRNHLELLPSLAAVLEQRAAAAPLATLNILMSLFQLRYFPTTVLHRVFSRAFVADVTSSPCGRIARNYLSLLDAAVQLELSNYSGPRLEPWCRVRMFHRLLTADGAQCSYKGLVREALQQLVGKEGYQQDMVVPPGYCIDFLLCISSSGRVLPISGAASAAAAVAANPQAAPVLPRGACPPASKSCLPGTEEWRASPGRSGSCPACPHRRGTLQVRPAQAARQGPTSPRVPVRLLGPSPVSPRKRGWSLMMGHGKQKKSTGWCSVLMTIGITAGTRLF
ncbi:hypothetical protein JRQ81_018394 [Phrynocephalus forsythii]|uniref:Fas-activated serine/threonine kinase n=1 Tax=Phrynocephalus forsythii TaxID=171643 RepID=A0A9Q0XQX2_9SAUR|nr:hypothetical protein JRQ81_018394 [Phrynocephalus forsythii]